MNAATITGPGATLADLAQLTGGHIDPAHADVWVTSAAIGSKDVQPNGLFCAVAGTKVHGAHYAHESNAAAIITDAAGAKIIAQTNPELPVLTVADVRESMGYVAARIYGNPSQRLTIIGVTGTSGKTTVTYLMEKALLRHHRVGIIGTTGTRVNGTPLATALTTPEAPTMQALLALMVQSGVSHVVMEVSSHALELGRVNGIKFDVAGFTNLSQDHLDFHPSMEAYFQAKKTLFTHPHGMLDNGQPDPQLPRPVVCVDDEWGQRLATELAHRSAGTNADTAENTSDVFPQAITIASTATTTNEAPAGEQVAPEERAGERATTAEHSAEPASPTIAASPATWQVHNVQVTSNGRQEVTLHTPRGELTYSIGLAGTFNVTNSIIALACVSAAAEDPTACAAAIRDVQVPGRMQAIDIGQDFLAVVDYAHKPAAVGAVMRTLRAYLPDPSNRIGIVLGAGGNRDSDKRPLMGKEAASTANAIFVTDDNPRDEDPAHIRRMILAGITPTEGQEVVEIPDRASAIRRAVSWAQPGDAIVIAGKGHETGQIIGAHTHHFSDVEELTAALRERGTGKEKSLQSTVQPSTDGAEQ